VWSHRCGLDDLVTPYAIEARVAEWLDNRPGWSRRWTATWKSAQAEVTCPVREMAGVAAAPVVPVRRFSWRPDQRHRPGLTFMVSTGRMHGFESLAERLLLLALDFAGGVEEVLAQPFRLKFSSVVGKGEHTPDFLALAPGAGWLVDVRPADRIKEEDVLRFAAAGQAAAVAGWRYAVVTGWRGEVMTGIDTLSARRRSMTGRLGLQARLLELAGSHPLRFGELVDGTAVPAVARAHAVHLLWHRRLAVDLAQPLGDSSWIYQAGRP
jgi:hypothetical protein